MRKLPTDAFEQNDSDFEKLIGLDLNHFPSLHDAREKFEKGYLQSLLTLTTGNVSLAAKFAKRNRTEFYRLLNNHDINPASYRAESKIVTTNAGINVTVHRG